MRKPTHSQYYSKHGWENYHKVRLIRGSWMRKNWDFHKKFFEFLNESFSQTLHRTLRPPKRRPFFITFFSNFLCLGLIPAPFQERLLSSTCESEVLNALESLPSLNRSTLCLLFNFLSSVAQTAENRMSASALAVCIGPSLFRVQINPEGLETQNRANEIAHKFIKNYSTFFKFSGSNLHGTPAKSPKVKKKLLLFPELKLSL